MNDDVAEINGLLSERYQALSSTSKSLGMRLILSLMCQCFSCYTGL